jgi:hypothetical protein
LFVLLACGGWIAAVGLPGLTGAGCSAAQRAERARAASTYAKKMHAKRAAYFKTHKHAKDRALFVRRQRATLARLRKAAACVVPPGSSTTTRTTTTAPAPAPQVTFAFGPEMAASDQELIRADVQYAVGDEARLLGRPVAALSVFASANPDWLAQQQCAFDGRNDSGCIQITSQRYATGGSAAQGGPGGIFLYWADRSWQNAPASASQKIIAHEIFHTFQYQLDKLLTNGSTPFSQVRPSGPVWLDEGAPETVGYHVAADRGLLGYPDALAGQIRQAKQIDTPLSSLQTLDQTQIPGVYSLFHVAVDHLLSITPGGVAALTTYYDALGSGKAWPDAFAAAFGMTVDAYYANFAAYRSGL